MARARRDPPNFSRPPRSRDPEAVSGRVRPHDPFDLIRWLAYSQPDPRKALAELVQNALDAGARRVRVRREKLRGVPALSIFDDGEGVIPELDRPDALRFIATHVGYSRKRNLSPKERLELMTQGQYGIGLLGFWSLGERLEVRSALPGQRAHRLVLHRDSPRFEVEPLRGRLPLDERFTEVVVSGLHPAAMPALVGRRAADYLAAELRGQLLARQVELVYEDLVARGSGPRSLRVKPARFDGERIADLDRVEIPGFGTLRLEIYLAPPKSVDAETRGGPAGEGEATRGIAVYAGGTLVASHFGELANLGVDLPPWTDPRLTGLVDFPGFSVAPGARRGVLADAAAEAFAAALLTVEPRVAAALAALESAHAEALDRAIVRDLQRAFRELLRSKPRYTLPVVGDAGTRAPGGVPEAVAPADAIAPDAARGVPASETEDAGAHERENPEPPQAELFPSGPLHHATIVPSPLKVAVEQSRAAHVVPLDALGHPAAGDFAFRWEIEGSVGVLVDETGDAGGAIGPKVRVKAGTDAARGWLRAWISDAGAGVEVMAEAEVFVLDEIVPARSAEGIPPPVLLDEPHAPWRSRLRDGAWEVNAGHRDFRAITDRPALKLRYLALLFSKEIVLLSSGDPRLETALDQLVEVQAFADRGLAKRGRRKEG